MIEFGDEWANSISEAGYQAVKSYTGTGYIGVNEYLRGISDSLQSKDKELAINLHNVLKDVEIPCDCIVYRGASEQALGQFSSLSDEQLIGKIISDKGFMSTSIKYETSFPGAIKLVIEVPKGSHGVYVGSISSVGKYENEVLFDAGQVMRILDVSENKFGQKEIRVRILN